ncbi:single-stranded-DNA-specific exonuclease RecJ [Exiguobacterium antarcticum]|uniref:single-stranded-DNA-specific exonuclease RecJ n=1 Tax=Exiguobacterium antarcticum TaxID=132920 RepID=UPI000285EC0A|nr:single-stranded-DNA-specific exonuclease RecJ [Exiguobacterium antarcticum]AFS71046.1 Single-stranded-DNA-specific exonuclease recJ [Exiguobacterium antarcticum B7]
MYHSKKTWIDKEVDSLKINELAEQVAVSRQVAHLLVQRGFETAEQAKSFLEADQMDFHDPFLFQDMNKVVARIQQAADEGEMILIYGDYDVDGVSSAAILWHALVEIGAMAECYIPNRFTEGYGPNEAAFRWAAEEGFGLVITVDCGISGIDEAKVLQDLGVDLIITDHHEAKDVLPDAFAMIHPGVDTNYPYSKLAGAGVAFKVAHALLGRVPEELLDLAVLGTIADLVPLVGENRLLAAKGIEALNASERPGILALRKVCSLVEDDLTEESVGFAFGPRINAAGRLDSAMPALEMLLAETIEEASILAEQLDQQNKQRQDIVKNIAEEAIDLVERHYLSDRVLVVDSNQWNPGVVGIVASRLVEKYHRPVILLCHDAEKGTAKGSGRSIAAFDLFAELTRCEDILPHFGGHPAAPLEIDLRLNVSEISIGLIEEMGRLAPFGMGNPSPRVVVEGANIRDLKRIGRDLTHLKVLVTDGKTELDGIGFGFGDAVDEISSLADVSLMGSLNINEWNGFRKPQLMIQDLAVVDYQLFDYRGGKKPLTDVFELPEDMTTLVAFSKDTQTKYAERPLNGPIKANIVFLDLPEEESAFLPYLKEAERVYCAFKDEGYYFETIPSREEFKQYFNYFAKCPRDELRIGLVRLSKSRKWSKRSINFMHSVFSELDFLVTMEDGLPGVNPNAEKRDLTEAATYKRHEERQRLEQQYIYSSLAQLKERFDTLVEAAKQEEMTWSSNSI